MEDGGRTPQESDETLIRYLQSWGLREFHDEASYYEWQRATLSQEDLQALQLLVQQRQGGENKEADIQFYDLLANPPFLSVLYSQRFDYYLKIGSLISTRLVSAEHVLDFGCGVGILTCFFAQQHPETQFVGIDRSIRSIEIARCEAEKRHISNVQFRVSQDLGASIPALYDCIISTQALLQSEREPGLPSNNWRTFERIHDLSQQEELESRTGLKWRLDALLEALAPAGRLMCLEKTWNLGRRIFFQRALSSRKLFLVCDPVPCSFDELGERRIDGPLYEVSRVSVTALPEWNEGPYREEGETLYRCTGSMAERMGRGLGVSQSQETVGGQHGTMGSWSFRFGVWEQAIVWGFCETESGFRGLILGGEGERNLIFQLLQKTKHLTDSEFEELLQNCWGNFRDVTQNRTTPGYENHLPSAQVIYEALPRKIVQQESTFADGQGKEMHIEIGTTHTFHYLYWANTFDQRQILLMDEKGAQILSKYYQESLEEAHRSFQATPPTL
jgi:SAM-dependent methyltransferase